jgi:hypothetical protein
LFLIFVLRRFLYSHHQFSSTWLVRLYGWHLPAASLKTSPTQIDFDCLWISFLEWSIQIRERESTPFIMLYFYFFFHSVWWELPHLPIVSFICISLYTENTLCILISSVIHQAKCIVDFVALVGHQKHLLNTLVV